MARLPNNVIDMFSWQPGDAARRQEMELARLEHLRSLHPSQLTAEQRDELTSADYLRIRAEVQEREAAEERKNRVKNLIRKSRRS